ncbi:MAG: HIT domain-containing protein [Armatimonadota bacterium]|nr:HIT domain-containing protein [Armatimonadota bacterium]MDR7532395.1 HIT domain-containing protein [Armatimonadota bacterium]MDR7535322.1 HIT domain-containing protein [Armatimonadota bacterium]
MNVLWAPWRGTYVTAPKPDVCIFCEALAAADDRSRLIVHRDVHAFVMLNQFPYNSGHVMVVPYRHTARLDALSAEEAAAVVRVTALAIGALEAALAPQGFNVGLNLGRAAGAGIEDHLHLHVVPRWVGDTNFMPVVAATKVLPQHLEDTYDRLRAALGARLR